MGTRSIKRRLAKGAARLASLRGEVHVLTEQLRHLDADAEDEETRALVAENTAVSRDARHARAHAEAVRRQRDRLRSEIVELEARQDELLDSLNAAT